MTKVRHRFAITLLAFSLFSASTLSASVAISIDMGGSRNAISPLIYGLNDWQRDATTASMNCTLERMGGNRMTGYNWETNASNAGSDYINHSDNGLVSSVSQSLQSVPGEAVMLSVDHARSLGHTSLVTLQLAGYVAADTNGTVTASQAAPSSRWKAVKITKGSALSTTPDITDGYVYMDEQVNFLISKYGTSNNGGVLSYSLDNESDLWSNTHSLLHPAQPTVAEIISQDSAAAAMVKRLDPSALVFGYDSYGWNGFVSFQSAPDWTTSLEATYEWFISYYLAQMKARSDTAGIRLLDVLDIHYYPEATGPNANSVDTRITTSDDNSAGIVAARLQAPRSLWDGTYTETSWITKSSSSGPIDLIPRLQASIDAYYPGTKIGITEYDFGGHYNYSGGIAEADILGLFGKYGVYAACYWGDAVGFITPAFKVYRNYDGQNSTFGDVALPATNPDAASYSAYASVDSATGTLHLIAINKTASAQAAGISLANSDRVITGAKVYGFDESGGASIVQYASGASFSNGHFSYSLPAHSVLHFIFADRAVTDNFEVEVVDASSVKLLFKTVKGVSYRIETSSNLRDWSLADDTYDGDGGVLTVIQAMPTAQTFWRLVTVGK
jgi:hypothetical protein